MVGRNIRGIDVVKFNNLYNEILLEKDHRQKMMKFGIPDDVANYLHNLNDKYSIWFANQIKNMEGYQNSRSKVNWIRANLQTDMQGILDWIQSMPEVGLKNFNWEDAVKAQKDYHENIKIKTLEGEEENTILKKYNDGFYWVDLETKYCPAEKDSMGHCASSDKSETLFSLRRFSPETGIESFVTLGVAPSKGVWYQAKGKKNSYPKEKYHPYIADILVDNDIFAFETEFNSQNDFKATDLKEYIEKNPEQFENPDEIIEQIEENTISTEDFEQVLKDYEADKFKHFSFYVEPFDFEEYPTAYISFNLEIDLDVFGKYKQNVVNYFSKNLETKNWSEKYDFEKKIKDIIEDRDFYMEDYETEYDSYTLNFRGYVQDEDNFYTMDDEGLKSFERNVEYFRDLDSKYDVEKVVEDLKDFLIDEGVIPDPDKEYDEYNEIKPVPYDDPRQLKFPFAENIFVKLYNELIVG